MRQERSLLTVPAVTTPNSKSRTPIDIIRTLGEMLGNLVDTLGPCQDNLPDKVRLTVDVIPLLMAHIDIVMSVTVHVTRTVLRAAARARRRLAARRRRVLPRRRGVHGDIEATCSPSAPRRPGGVTVPTDAGVGDFPAAVPDARRRAEGQMPDGLLTVAGLGGSAACELPGGGGSQDAIEDSGH